MNDLVVFAKNRAEMIESQHKLVEWANQVLTEAIGNLNDVSANLEHARSQKWKLTGWRRQKRIAQRKVDFYQKIQAALVAGYVIVPDFPIDVFAVRTNRAYPLKQYNTTKEGWGDSTDRTQHSEVLPIGEGHYVDGEPVEMVRKLTEGNFQHFADEFKGVDFPIKSVKPVILEETSKALLLKIFDEIGCNPGRQGWSAGQAMVRSADPMVIGRIIYRREGDELTSRWRSVKSVSFLIAWWLKASDLVV